MMYSNFAAFDECVSNPCKYEGTCTNLPNEFTCACRDGFTGPTCEGFVDICQENYCQHGGTCSTIEGQLVCVCEVGLSGDHCEFEIIDGGWNGWISWTECPVTCGGGVHSRTRNCDNPEPQNGGQPCKGEGEQEEPCNTEECPEVQKAMEANGFSSVDYPAALCRSPAEKKAIEDEFRYQLLRHEEEIACLSLRTCQIESVEAVGCESVAVSRRSKRAADTGVTVMVTTQQNLTHGDDPESQPLGSFLETFDRLVQQDYLSSTVDDQVLEPNKSSVNLDANQKCPPGSFSAIQFGYCGPRQIESVEAVGCESVAVSRRSKRAADTGVTVMVTTQQNLTHGDDPESQPLGSFLETFDRLVQQDYLVLTVDDQVLEPNKSSVNLDANQKCPPGSFSAIQFGYCVPCGPGTYYSFLPDDYEYDCNPCPLNTYQEDAGQTECIPCPNGNVTAEPFSSNISDCFVPEAIPPVTPVTPEPGLEERNKLIISVTSFIAGLLVFAVTIVYMWHRRRTKSVRISRDKNNPTAHDSSALQLVELR
eukprot:XP_011663151.1 PREDICTED: uncharacterized protein LOC589650 [Strongylocentrotus purpuratus]